MQSSDSKPDPAAGGAASDPTASDPTSATPSGPPRRNFMAEVLSIVIGGFAGLFPMVVGLLVFFDPLRSKNKRDERFVKVAALDALLVDKPREFTVIDDLVDAWNLFPQEPIGSIYLIRTKDGQVQAFNRQCPHARCLVDYDRDRTIFQCPCHDSSFEIDGDIHNEKSPSARGLDSLEVDEEKLAQGEVWVKYQSFRPGTAKKIPEA